MTELDRGDVEHIAELARVELEGDLDRYVSEFNQILDYFETLDEVPGEVEHKDRLENVLRDDEPRPSLPRDEVLRNADETEERYIRGPRVS